MSVFLSLLFITSASNAARILGYVPTPSYSHQIVFKPLWIELSLRGHQVTTITTLPINDPTLVNLTEIDLTYIQYEFTPQLLKIILTLKDMNFITYTLNLYTLMTHIISKQLEDPAVHKLINDPDTKFDLVIVEYLFTIGLAFAERFNCPSIGMISLDGSNLRYKAVGSPMHTTLYPDSFVPFVKPLNLKDRILSFTGTILFDLLLMGRIVSMEQEVVKKHFGNHYPPIPSMDRNISMLFVNADPIFHQLRPLVPAIVQIGSGSHRSTPRPLPEDLKWFLDGATNGFIYCSLGSNVRSEHLPLETINTFLETFSELPYRVLWKYENSSLSNKPDNVFISRWIPQQSVLNHTNIKLFITQGGLQSMDEAIYEHVPMIGIPFFGDQPYNVQKMASMGMGLELDRTNLHKKQLKETVLEVINNHKYRSTVKKLAELAQDQSMTGLEKAVWWSEYVIRHKGARHLRSPLLEISWCQYLLLDVIGVLLLVILVIVSVVYFIIRSIIRSVKWKCCTSKLKEKKN